MCSSDLNKTHQTIKKVTDDFETRYAFNTAIASIMELLNSIPKSFVESDASASQKFCLQEAIVSIVQCLFPIAPHICEQIWCDFYDGPQTCIEESWPKYDKSLLESDMVPLVIQVNGKLRGKINIDKSMPEKSIKELASQEENVMKFLDGKEIKKIIYIKQKIINFVI